MTLPNFRPAAVLSLALLLGAAALAFASQQSSGAAQPQTASQVKTPPGQKPVKPEAPEPDSDRALELVERGRHLESQGHLEEALAAYDEAVEYAPRDPAILAKSMLLRTKLLNQYTSEAERLAVDGKIDESIRELQKALKLDSGNSTVRERLQEIRGMSDDLFHASPVRGLPQLKPTPGTHNFHLRGDTKAVYTQVAQAFGVKVSFDPDLAVRQAQVNVDNVDFPTAMSVLGLQTGTFWRPLNASLFFVAADTTEKHKQFGMEAEQTFYLPASVSAQDMTELLRIMRDIIGTSRINLNAASRSIVMRDSPEKLALASQVIQQAEHAPGELLLDIDILEVDKNTAMQLGVTPPTSAKGFFIPPNEIAALKQATDLSNAVTLLGQFLSGQGFSSIPTIIPFGGGYSTFLLTISSQATATFTNTLNLVKSGQEILLRAQDGKPATFFVGERYPVTLSQLSNSLGSPTGTTPFTGIPTSTSFPESNFTVGNNPVAVAAGDFNLDGQTDLAVANENDNSVTVLINQQGSGNFLIQTQSPNNSLAYKLLQTPAPELAPVALVSAQLGNTVTNTSTGGSALANDLLVVNSASANVTVLLSNGDGTFTEATSDQGSHFNSTEFGSPFPVGNSPSSIVTADFNGDGNLDFAVTNQADNTVTIYLGDGKGGFLEAPYSPFTFGNTLAIEATSLPVAVVNQPYNASLQIAGVTPTNQTGVSIQGLPAGITFSTTTGALVGSVTAAPGTYPLTITVSAKRTTPTSVTTTLNLVVVATAPTAQTPQVIGTLSNGNVGAPYNETLLASGGTAPYTWAVTGGSLPPGLSLNGATGVISGTIEEPPGGASTAECCKQPQPPPATGYSFSVTATDSSKTALTATQSYTLTPSSAAERGPVAMVTGNFRNMNLVSNTLSNLTNLPEADLAIVNQVTDNVTVLLDTTNSQGVLTFQESTDSPLTVGHSPVAIATADLNADGVLDLAVVNQADDSISILLGNTNNETNTFNVNFTPAVGSPIPTSANPVGITIANFTSGNVPSLAVTNQGPSTLGIYVGLGAGEYASRIEITTPATPGAIISSVLSSSGLPDVALTAQGSTAGTGVVTVILDSAEFAALAAEEEGAGGLGAGEIPYPGSEFIDIGVKLKATPMLHLNHEVTLALDFQINALAGTAVNGIPVLSNRTLTQTVRLKEDQTSIIGGLMEDDSSHGVSGIPGLATLPGIGYAFGTKNKSNDGSELLILVTPRHLRSPASSAPLLYAGRGGNTGTSAAAGPEPAQGEHPPAAPGRPGLRPAQGVSPEGPANVPGATPEQNPGATPGQNPNAAPGGNPNNPGPVTNP